MSITDPARGTPAMFGLKVNPVPGAERLVELHAAELPQKDELCGAFWGTLALRAAGFVATPEPIDQDAVGVAAGSVLSTAASDDLPAGEAGRTDYRLSFPMVDDTADSGTSVVGLVRAVQELSSGRLVVLPVAGPWSGENVGVVLDAAATCTQCTVIANLSTGHLWGSRPSPVALVAYLTSGDSNHGPEPDWDVGHFVGLLGRIEGPRGTLVIVADTYRSLGWDAIHVQPAERLAHGLARTGSDRPSGVLLVVAADEAPGVEQQLRSAGLELHTWDNGSPDMAATR
jgi:hypothetical protein